MKKLDLAGIWSLSRDGGAPVEGRLPGCTYLDCMAAGMEDPFWGENEKTATELAHHDYTYSRTFAVEPDLLSAEHVDFVARGIDTLCTVTVNGQVLAETDNINRTWRLPVRELLRPGENEISLFFPDPYVFAEEKLAADPVPGNFKLGEGFNHLRKTACHFGWDWGPELPPAGITGSVGLEAWDARIEDLRIVQRHEKGEVELEISWETVVPEGESYVVQVVLEGPDGSKQEDSAPLSGSAGTLRMKVDSPRLWWCNGLGGQPLYRLSVSLNTDGKTAWEETRQIGLRTIELDTAPDEHGDQFRFIVNGVPIFARGAD